MSASQEVKTWW